jgi:hypothetical protein
MTTALAMQPTLQPVSAAGAPESITRRRPRAHGIAMMTLAFNAIILWMAFRSAWEFEWMVLTGTAVLGMSTIFVLVSWRTQPHAGAVYSMHPAIPSRLVYVNKDGVEIADPLMYPNNHVTEWRDLCMMWSCSAGLLAMFSALLIAYGTGGIFLPW